MKEEKTEYEYYDLGEDTSQYGDIDLEHDKVVEARYIKAANDIDRGNPYIEALPPPRIDGEVEAAYERSLPGHDPDAIKDMDKVHKMDQIDLLREVRFQLPFHERLETDMHEALMTSYRSRNPLQAGPQGVSYTAHSETEKTSQILVGDQTEATNAGFSLTGYSGCGKTSSLHILLSRYPQVIVHKNKNRQFIQIVYISVNCGPNSSFYDLYAGIGDAIDKALGNAEPVYKKEIEKLHSLALERSKAIEFIEKFAVGMIIFDEIQNMSFNSHVQNSYEALLTIANTTKVAFALVGTEDARQKMVPGLRTARRVGRMIDGSQYCESKKFFGILVQRLFDYQWFDELVEVTDDIIDAFYDVTNGIISQLIEIYSCVNYEYLDTDKTGGIDGDYIRKVANKYYPGIQEVLKDMKREDWDEEMSKRKKLAHSKMQEAFDRAEIEQEHAAENALIDESESRADKQAMLVNITRAITACFGNEYTSTDIEKAFRKIMSKKNSGSLTEQQINSEVVKALQGKAEKDIPKKKNPPGVEDMKSSLGIKNA